MEGGDHATCLKLLALHLPWKAIETWVRTASNLS